MSQCVGGCPLTLVFNARTHTRARLFYYKRLIIDHRYRLRERKKRAYVIILFDQFINYRADSLACSI